MATVPLPPKLAFGLSSRTWVSKVTFLICAFERSPKVISKGSGGGGGGGSGGASGVAASADCSLGAASTLGDSASGSVPASMRGFGPGGGGVDRSTHSPREQLRPCGQV